MDIFKSVEILGAALLRSDLVEFHRISDDDDIWYATVECQLTDEQIDFVNPAGFTLGRAYLNPSEYYPCIIKNNRGAPVGFICLNKWLGAGNATSWSYFIAKENQEKGYGIAAAKLAITVLKTAFHDIPIKLATECANLKAQKLYRKLGFTFEGEYDGDDMVFIYR